MESREFRVYVDELGDDPAAKDVIGEGSLEITLMLVRNAYPRSTIYVREINESVVQVIRPDEKLDSGFHFTS